jgi:hypothetical protein
MENTLNGEICTESVHISVNNTTNLKKILILTIYTIWDRVSLKTISRYCPFNALKFCNGFKSLGEKEIYAFNSEAVLFHLFYLSYFRWSMKVRQ